MEIQAEGAKEEVEADTKKRRKRKEKKGGNRRGDRGDMKDGGFIRRVGTQQCPKVKTKGISLQWNLVILSTAKHGNGFIYPEMPAGSYFFYFFMGSMVVLSHA